eukprot:g31205.t1
MFWYDFIYEGEREGQWTPWLTFALVVPTVDSIRLTHTFSTLLLKDFMIWHKLDKPNTADEHVIVAGETGTGKSVYLSLWLQKDALESIIPLSINFSAQTHVNQLQDLLNSKFEKRRHGVYGPPAGEKNVIFIDDLNMPKKEYYGQIYNGTGCKDCAAGFYDATPEIDVDECLECPNDAASDPGSAACLPLVAPWVQQQVPPSVTVVRNFAGKIEVVAQAAVLPNQFYSTPAVPSYSIDIAPTKESLQPRSACSVLWQPQAAQNSELTEMVAELTYPDLDDKCQLNEKQVGDLIHRDGFLGVYVLFTGTVESTIAFFAFPLELKFIRTAEGIYTGYVAAGSHHIDQQVFFLGSCHSTVNFFRTENFEQPLEPAVYVVGDVVYAEHTLETDHLTLEVVQVWISSSKNPDDWDALSENLTDAMVLLTGQGSQGRARFTFQARPQSCQLCFVHVLSRVTQTSGRRFSMQQMHALKFSPIVIQPKEEGLPFIMSIEQSLAIAVTVALAGFLLALVCKFKCAHGKDQWKCGCVPVFLMVESFDCFLDVAAWIGASLTGDLTFSDDGGFVGNTLLASTVGSCVLFGGVLVLLRVC